MAKPRRFQLREIEAALRRAGGIYADAARLLTEAGKPCTRQNIRYWVQKYTRLAETIDDCMEEIKDLAESKLIENISGQRYQCYKIFFGKKSARSRLWCALRSYWRRETTAFPRGPSTPILARQRPRY
jgi:hypothetical protein